MAGRSAHVRRTSIGNRTAGERRASSQGDTSPRVPAPAGLGLGAPPAGDALGLLQPYAQNTRGGSVSQPPTPIAPQFSNEQTNGTSSGSNVGGQGRNDGQSHLTVAGGGGQQGPKRVGFLGLGDMLQLSSAGLLATSAHAHQSHSHSSANTTSHTLAAAAHSVLAATSFLAAAAPHHRAATSPIPSSLLPTRTHSRGEAAVPLDRAHSPVPSPPMAAPPLPPPTRTHTSPSKASSARTYDSKLVSREMHRLGNLAHLPSLQPGSAPSLTLSAAPSSITLNMAPTSAPSINATLSGESPWASLHVLILPLFNRERLRVQIEDLNQLVRRHISTVVSAAPGKAVATLEHDTLELIATGMVTLNAELSGVEDEKLVLRLVETWTFFWGQVLPYLEGALLPLQTDPILSSLYRMPKSHRPSSPTSTQNGKASTSNLVFQSSPTQIDVRSLALVLFRDRIILPLFPKLYARLTMSKDGHSIGPETQQARLQQMLLVLVSQRSQRLVSLSLTAPPPQPSAGEAAITRLLRALHAPITTLAPRHNGATGGSGAPSFLSAGLPRDRRGRIAQKVDLGSPRLQGRGRDRWRWRAEAEDEAGGGGDGYGSYGQESAYWDEGEADTPRVGVAFADPARERDKELLESLRSPDPDSSARMNTTGWGSMYPQAGIPIPGAEDDDADAGLEGEEDLDWDQAQAMVEHMVGIGAKPESGSQGGSGQDTRRGRAQVEGYKV